MTLNSVALSVSTVMFLVNLVFSHNVLFGSRDPESQNTSPTRIIKQDQTVTEEKEDGTKITTTVVVERKVLASEYVPPRYSLPTNILRLIRLLLVLFVVLSLGILFKTAVARAFNIDDDGHIYEIFRAKLIGSGNFHTKLSF